MPKFDIHVLPGFNRRLAMLSAQDKEFVLGVIDLLDKMHINRAPAIKLLKELAGMISAHTRSISTEDLSKIITPGDPRWRG